MSKFVRMIWKCALRCKFAVKEQFKTNIKNSTFCCCDLLPSLLFSLYDFRNTFTQLVVTVVDKNALGSNLERSMTNLILTSTWPKSDAWLWSSSVLLVYGTTGHIILMVEKKFLWWYNFMHFVVLGVRKL